MTTKFNKGLPHATVHGVQSEPGKPAPAFEQNGRYYAADGTEVGSSGSKAPEAPTPVKAGEGDIAHGAFDKAFKPLEEGGGGAGITESWPQTTTEARQILDEDESAGALTGEVESDDERNAAAAAAVTGVAASKTAAKRK